MTPDTTLTLEPVVGWPRAMMPGRPYLVAVDLRLAGPAGDWPYDEEEFAFTCVLDGSTAFIVEATHDASVVLHRFGGSYGPAEFVVTPHDEPGRRSLWLTIVTPRGVAVRTVELPVDVRAAVEDTATTTRPVRAVVSAQRRPVPPAPEWRVCLVAGIAGYGRRASLEQTDAQERLHGVLAAACRASGVDPGACEHQAMEDGSLLILPPELDAEVVIPRLARGLEVALGEINAEIARTDRLRLRVVLAEGEIRSGPNGLAGAAVLGAVRLTDSVRLRDMLALDPDGDLALLVISERRRAGREPPAEGRWGEGFVPVDAPLPEGSFLGAWQLMPRLRGGIADLFAMLFPLQETALAILAEIGYLGSSGVAHWRQRLLEEVDLDDLAMLTMAQRRARLEKVTGHLLRREGPVLPADERRDLIRRVVDEVEVLGRVPATAIEFWREVIRDLLNGVIPGGLERLVEAAGRRFPGNSDLARLRAAPATGAPGDPALFGRLLLPDTHLIIDGDSVAETGYGDLPVEDQRMRLLSGLGGPDAELRAEITCVFTGGEVIAPFAIPVPRGVRVMFSARGETVDSFIARLVQAEPARRAVVVVSSDPGVADAVRNTDAFLVPSATFLHRIDSRPARDTAAGDERRP